MFALSHLPVNYLLSSWNPRPLPPLFQTAHKPQLASVPSGLIPWHLFVCILNTFWNVLLLVCLLLVWILAQLNNLGGGRNIIFCTAQEVMLELRSEYTYVSQEILREGKTTSLVEGPGTLYIQAQRWVKAEWVWTSYRPVCFRLKWAEKGRVLGEEKWEPDQTRL